MADDVLIADGSFFPKHVVPPDEPPQTEAVVPAISEESIKRVLGELTRELLAVTDVTKARQLNIQIQRNRVALILLQESANKEPSGDYHKEMQLLNRMLSGEEDPELGKESSEEEQAAIAAATAELERRGVSPKSAAAMMHVLNAIVSRIDAHGSRPAS